MTNPSNHDIKALEAAAQTLVYVSAANFHERGSGVNFLPNDAARSAAAGVITAYLDALVPSPSTGEAETLSTTGAALLALLDDYMVVSSLTANDRYKAALEAFRSALTPRASTNETVGVKELHAAISAALYHLHEGLSAALPSDEKGWLLRSRFTKAEDVLRKAVEALPDKAQESHEGVVPVEWREETRLRKWADWVKEQSVDGALFGTVTRFSDDLREIADKLASLRALHPEAATVAENAKVEPVGSAAPLILNIIDDWMESYDFVGTGSDSGDLAQKRWTRDREIIVAHLASLQFDAALHPASIPAAPEGWRLVPERPNDEQMQAGLYQASADAEWEDVFSSYVDMVEAAPKPALAASSSLPDTSHAALETALAKLAEIDSDMHRQNPKEFYGRIAEIAFISRSLFALAAYPSPITESEEVETP